MQKLKLNSSAVLAAILLLAAVFLSSCGFNSLDVKNNVEKKFPKAKAIVRPAGKAYTYIVIDSVGFVWWAESTSPFNADVDKVEMLANSR